jgi:hypothetical protein
MPTLNSPESSNKHLSQVKEQQQANCIVEMLQNIIQGPREDRREGREHTEYYNFPYHSTGQNLHC